MSATLQKVLLTALGVLSGLSSFGQSNVYTLRIYSGGVGYGPSWVVGSPPIQFGFEEYSYWAHWPGRERQLSITGTREIAPSDEHHTRTRVFLGPVSFSVPLPRLATVVFGSIIVLVLVSGSLVYVARFRTGERT